MNDEQLLRYSRHIFLPDLDLDGQLNLCHSHVLIIGLGGLGAAALPYLAASGVGTLTLVDDDVVESSNLPRQIIHTPQRVGLPKVESARLLVASLNADVQVIAEQRRADEAWLLQALPGVDLVLDCSDNPEVRYALNRAALQHKTPWVSGAAVAMDGQVTLFDPRRARQPLLPLFIPTGTGRAAELQRKRRAVALGGRNRYLAGGGSVKLLAPAGNSLCGRLLTFDARSTQFREWKISRRADCPDCGGQH